MDIRLDYNTAAGYNSGSQKARLFTESWVAANLYCPVCGHVKINQFPNNRAVADFFCPNCSEQYELKSKNGILKNKIADGSYDTFLRRVSENSNPNFLFMSYSKKEMLINDLYFVPKFCVTPEIAEKRKPLSENAKRHGWVGCNILYDRIPLQGRIEIIRSGIVIDKEIVRAKVQKAFGLKMDDLDSRGWMFDVLHCVNDIASEEFSLAQVYQYEKILEEKHPDNHNIRAKIRQQLQVLRDHGIIEFFGNGNYGKVRE